MVPDQELHSILNLLGDRIWSLTDIVLAPPKETKMLQVEVQLDLLPMWELENGNSPSSNHCFECSEMKKNLVHTVQR